MKFLLSLLFLFPLSGLKADTGTSYTSSSSAIQIPLINNISGDTLVNGGVVTEGGAYCGTGSSSTTCQTCGDLTICYSCQCNVGYTGAQWLTQPKGSSITITYTAANAAATVNITFVYDSNGNIYAYMSDSAEGFSLNGVSSSGTHVAPNNVANPYTWGQYSLTYTAP